MLKNLLYLTGFSTFVVILMVSLDVYRNYQLSQLPPVTQKNIVPIEKSFDTKTLNDLKKREQVVVSMEDKSTVTSEDTKEATGNLAPTPNVSNDQLLSSRAGSLTIPGSTVQP